MLSPLEEQTVARIEAEHWPIRAKFAERIRKQRVCNADGQSWPCNESLRAADIRARDTAGRPREHAGRE